MANGAVIAAKRRRILLAFREAGALSPKAARPPADLGVSRSLLLKTMMRRSIVIETEDGRWWLDERAEAADHRARRIRVIVLLLVAIAVVAAIAWLR